MPSLTDLGWNDLFSSDFARLAPADAVPARVIEEFKDSYRLLTTDGEYSGKLRGALRHQAFGREDFPAVGDWVAASVRPGDELAVIEAVVPRRTKLSRKVAGRSSAEQIVAANVDVFFLATSLNQDLNLRRLERYLVAVWDSGALPAILLTKVDLIGDAAPFLAEVAELAPGVAIIPVSATTGLGVEAVRALVPAGRTAALIGSSGVGKSTLVNALLSEARQEVQDIRDADGRGRHTTVGRTLIALPSGGWLMDTPGMREFAPWSDGGDDAGEGLNEVFADVRALAEHCKFRDCRHDGEPGCAVLAAIEAGDLPEERLTSLRKLEKEEAWLRRRADKSAAAAERQKWKTIHKALRRGKPRD